jgi:hypothetical protein
MADALAALLNQYEDILRRSFEADPTLKDVEIDLAELIAEEAARMTVGSLRWRLATGESITTKDLTLRWQVTRQAIAKQVKTGHLLGVPGRTTTYFPTWQFDETTSEVRPVVIAILKVFAKYCGQVDPMVIASWAATPQPELHGLSPRDWIERRRNSRPLLKAAEATARGLAV